MQEMGDHFIAALFCNVLFQKRCCSYRHEDGSVRFWDVSGVCMRLLYTLRTAQLYGLQPPASEPTTDEWPPFRKVKGKSLMNDYINIFSSFFSLSSPPL